MTALSWLPNDAGPLLLLPASLLSEWSGIDAPEFRTVSASFRWNENDALDRAGVDDVVRQERSKASERRKLFGLF